MSRKRKRRPDEWKHNVAKKDSCLEYSSDADGVSPSPRHLERANISPTSKRQHFPTALVEQSVLSRPYVSPSIPFNLSSLAPRVLPSVVLRVKSV
uniref:Uncharacterized protein n=1 Tax=Timema poppense TaxID=170557 RepID=A0A7R9DCD4_TIMPO|nr:unnamed protein product [Timema poppensis]